MQIISKDKSALTQTEIVKISELLMATWPPEDDSFTLENAIEVYTTENTTDFGKVFQCYHEEELLGHTAIFNRTIILESKNLDILALAGVCVKMDQRGKNIGAELVRQAFAYVDNVKFPCSLFQTNVPGFYEKLDCKQINNRFINSRSESDPEANPWNDPYVMVYPKTYDLGDGTIDLNGKCY